MARTLPWRKAESVPQSDTRATAKRRRSHASGDADVLDTSSPRSVRRRLRESISYPCINRMPLTVYQHDHPLPHLHQSLLSKSMRFAIFEAKSLTKCRLRYMRDGFAADDTWIMVEDEFLQTARLFTQHLHHAEYQRLKSLAKVQKASEIQSLVRPTTNPERMSLATRKALDIAAKSQAQDEMLGKMRERPSSPAGDMESSDDEPFLVDPKLAGLMTRPSRPAQRLSGLATASANTRAAAGFAKPTIPPSNYDRHSSQETGDLHHEKATNLRRIRPEAIDEASHDRNGPSQPRRKAPGNYQQLSSDSIENLPLDPRASLNLLSKKRQESREDYETSNLSKRIVEPTNQNLDLDERKSGTISSLNGESRFSTEIHEQQSQDSPAFLSRMKERREARRRRFEGQTQPQSTRFGEVPTFLI